MHMELAAYVLTMTSNVTMMGIHKTDRMLGTPSSYTGAMSHSTDLKLIKTLLHTNYCICLWADTRNGVVCVCISQNMCV